MKTSAIIVIVLLVCFSFAIAEEQEKPKMPEKGTKGEITGEIIKKDGAKITVKNEETELVLMPFWRGGMPADGGGFDKDMVKKLEGFKVGDKVKVTWMMEEHYRIVTIEHVEETE
jgi:hypothetical protein